MHSDLPMEAKKAVATIVREYDPERIVLFGRYAEGRPTRDSDLDLLIVKATTERPFDRSLRVRRLLRGTEIAVPIDLLILTPEEVELRLARGDAFLDTILRRGVVLHAA